jgi:hypothetical protein
VIEVAIITIPVDINELIVEVTKMVLPATMSAAWKPSLQPD